MMNHLYFIDCNAVTKIKILTSLFFLLFIFSCGGEAPKEQAVNETVEEATEEGTPPPTSVIPPAPVTGIEKNEDAPSFDDSFIIPDAMIEKENYKINLKVNEYLKKQETAELRVWIGPESKEIEPIEGMAHDETVIPSNVGKYAKVTPYAPDFEIISAKEKCIKINDEVGSTVRFSLKPKKVGDLKVSADVELFDNPDCSGASVPQVAETLSVNVKVDIKHGTYVLLGIAWDKIQIFFAGLITLILGAILFIIRKKIKKKTGYQGEE